MTQENKELLLKDICARLPYEVKVSVDNKHWCDFHKDIPVKLTLDNTYRILLGVSLGYVKPYLFPLSSMTEEATREFSATLEWIKAKGHSASVMTYDSFDCLNKHHIDYRGLIPLGLALDATGLNIY